MGEERDNVIHVVFGRSRAGGDAQVMPPPPPPPTRVRVPPNERPQLERAFSPEPPPSTSPVRERGDDPLSALYSVSEVAKLFALTASRLRYWDRSGFMKPSGRFERRRYYTFQDLIGLRVAKALLDGGVPLKSVRKSVDALRRNLPKVARPLAELRVVADGHSVVVRDDAHSFEPSTGQLVLDFEVCDLRDDVVRVLHPKGAGGPRRQQAYDLYLEGCRLDEEEATADRAEEAYRRSIQLDPSLANAFTNLGNLRFRRGAASEAEQLYRHALEIDPAQPEALYNLGFLHFERHEPELAAQLFRGALESDPGFADAHFNLAMACEEIGRPEEAQKHWRTYLKLDPAGPWAEIARRHVQS